MIILEQSVTFWIIFNYFCKPFGPFRTLFWTILDQLGPYWTISDHLGKFWTISEYFGPVLDQFGLFWSILHHLKPLWTNQFEPFWIILNHFELLCNRFDIFGSFWTISVFFGPLLWNLGQIQSYFG